MPLAQVCSTPAFEFADVARTLIPDLVAEVERLRWEGKLREEHVEVCDCRK